VGKKLKEWFCANCSDCARRKSGEGDLFLLVRTRPRVRELDISRGRNSVMGDWARRRAAEPDGEPDLSAADGRGLRATHSAFEPSRHQLSSGAKSDVVRTQRREEPGRERRPSSSHGRSDLPDPFSARAHQDAGAPRRPAELTIGSRCRSTLAQERVIRSAEWPCVQ